jgi:hypothetical protein
MARVITNGKQTIKLYHSVNRGKPLFQLAYYAGGRRVLKNRARAYFQMASRFLLLYQRTLILRPALIEVAKPVRYHEVKLGFGSSRDRKLQPFFLGKRLQRLAM